METCKYCGQSAGFFSRVHKECEEKHERGLKGVGDLMRLYDMFDMLNNRCSRYIVFFLAIAILMLNRFSLSAQKIYSVDHDYQADVKVFVVDSDYNADLVVFRTDKEYRAKKDENKGIWFFTDKSYRADKKVFFVDREYKADLKVFFTDKEYRSGWRINRV